MAFTSDTSVRLVSTISQKTVPVLLRDSGLDQIVSDLKVIRYYNLSTVGLSNMVFQCM